jgi:hypothetical protein
MPQLASLILTDRAATPVNHTFVPRDIVNNVATVVESTGVPVGDKRVTLSTRRTPQGNVIVDLKMTFPIVNDQTINGVTTPVVVRTGYADLSLKFSATSTEQERKDLVGQLYSALDASKWTNDVLTKLQAVY